jgi:hypothetical protein
MRSFRRLTPTAAPWSGHDHLRFPDQSICRRSNASVRRHGFACVGSNRHGYGRGASCEQDPAQQPATINFFICRLLLSAWVNRRP